MDGIDVHMNPDQQSASAEVNHAGIVTLLRDFPPTHYTIKIESFSELQNIGIKSFESGEFEASGYHWKLIVYPNGNQKSGVDDHVSLYLAISDVAKLPKGYEINAYFKFFVFDHIRDKFLMVQDASGETKRFHQMKTEWGIDKFLNLEGLKDASKGYLSNDCFTIGVEVFVIKNYGFGERFVTVRDPPFNTFTWKIKNFEAIKEERLSEEFQIGDYKWKISLYPNGNGAGKETAMSLYLVLVDSKTAPLKRKVYADFLLRLKDQHGGNHIEENVGRWFSPSKHTWGYPKFVNLAKLKSTSNGYLVNDTVVVKAKITLISSSSDF